jgi:uncharacterized protein (TIGR00299 family) protein
MKIAYFDAASGISGDMAVGALLDVGAPRFGLAELRACLGLLDLQGYALDLARVHIDGVPAASFRVRIDEGGQPSRDWARIRVMIESAAARGLGAGTVERSLQVFQALAAAEARVHGVPAESVHFHEVGAVDSIVDIVSACWCLDELEIDACFVGPLPSGSGWVETDHGVLPVPAPATVELLRGFDVVAGDGDGELVTPTGAAILSALATSARPGFTLQASGAGAGTRRLEDRPNVLRVLIGDCDERADDEVAVIECDIDDMTPAALSHIAERLRSTGARDVTLLPVMMKKGRTALRLTVLCDLADIRRLSDLLLAESSTIGVRYRIANRIVLPRRMEIVATEFGPIAVKIVRRPESTQETAEPELDDLSRAAVTHGKPLAAVRAAVIEAWTRSLKRR